MLQRWSIKKVLKKERPLLEALGLQFYQKRLQHRRFTVNIAKPLGTSSLQNNSGSLLLGTNLFFVRRIPK